MLSDMTDHPHEWLRDQPAAAALLGAYALSAETASAGRESAKAAAPENPDDPVEADDADDSASWLPRITQLADVDPSTMPALHGRLIALGLLRFELFGRAGGMRYRLSPLGRRALAPPPAVPEELEPAAEPLQAELAA
jgi:hypothetical protein